MKIALCCIGRQENRYAVEYVEFYKSMGIDKIFIYDNNYGDEEHFEEVLQPYIDENFVEIIDFRSMSMCQIKAYNDCYDKHGNEYDWICFFDFDEFILLEKEKNLKDLLSYEIYKNYDLIHINWLCYGDCGLEKYEDKLVLERFDKPIFPLTFKKNLNVPENYHVKSIVKGGVGAKWRDNSHTPCNISNACTASGKPSNGKIGIKEMDYKNICLRHFTTKTIEEYYNIKVKRGFPNADKFYFKEHDWVKEFFKVNEKTIKKYLFADKVENKNKLDLFIGTYKTFTPIVKNIAYKIIYGNHNIITNDNLIWLQCKSNEKLDDRFYSEFYMLKNLPKEWELNEYVGFCHYRKYFSFLDNIPDLDEIFKMYDAIMTSSYELPITVKEQYAKFHNVEDLEIVENIIKKNFKEYYKSFEKVINGKKIRYFNMFIMKKEDFNNYIKFMDGVLQKYIEMVGTDIEKRIENNKDKYLKESSPQNTVEFQYRIGGYLIERLLNVFADKHFKNIREYDIKLTEVKYE